MTATQAFKKDCVRCAKALGDYQSIGIDDLANGYCKAYDEGDESKKNSYMSALILRFWYTIKKMYDKTITANYGTYDDYVSKLYECISVVMAPGSRAWQDPTKNISAQACINQAIASRGVAEIMYESNLDKKKANAQAVSLDSPVGADPDSDTLLDTQADPESDVDRARADMAAEHLVQTCIDRDKIVEAIVLDVIAFGDCERVTKKIVKAVDSEGNEVKYARVSTEFWRYRAVQNLASLPGDYESYFSERYSVKPEILGAAMSAIRKSNNQRLYRYLDASLVGARRMLEA